MELTRKVITDIEDTVNATVTAERRGTETVGADVEVDQTFKVTNVTMQDINSSIQNVIKNVIIQDDKNNQNIRSIKVEAACQGEVKLSNDLFAEKVVSDLIDNVSKVITSSDEFDKLKLSAKGETENKSTGTLAVALDTIGGIVGSLTTGWVGIILGIALLLFLLIFGAKTFFGAFLPGGGASSDNQMQPFHPSTPMDGVPQSPSLSSISGSSTWSDVPSSSSSMFSTTSTMSPFLPFQSQQSLDGFLSQSQARNPFPNVMEMRHRMPTMGSI
jgi:hypothetical protein